MLLRFILYLTSIFLVIVFSSFRLESQIQVSSPDQLEAAIKAANRGEREEIFFQTDIEYEQLFQPLNSDHVLAPMGRAFKIDGFDKILKQKRDPTEDKPFPGFFVIGPGGLITIKRLTIENAIAKGGHGGQATNSGGGFGGGGMGAGGGLFVHEGASVRLENTKFINCRAEGGRGFDTGTSRTTGSGGAGGGSLRGGNGGSVNSNACGAGSGAGFDADGVIKNRGLGGNGGSGFKGRGGTGSLGGGGGGGGGHNGGSAQTSSSNWPNFNGAGGSGDCGPGADSQELTEANGGCGIRGQYPGDSSCNPNDCRACNCIDGGSGKRGFRRVSEGGGGGGGGSAKRTRGGGGGSAGEIAGRGGSGAGGGGGGGGGFSGRGGRQGYGIGMAVGANGGAGGNGFGGGGGGGGDFYEKRKRRQSGNGGNGGFGGGGGGAGSTDTSWPNEVTIRGNGGNGGFGGGGGGGGGGGERGGQAGKGGFGGGGGGGGSVSGQAIGNDNAGGDGGFGGGGGGAGSARLGNARAGKSDFGGGSGVSGGSYAGGSGGGAGLGGAIFIQKGGTVTIAGNITFQNNKVIAGKSANNTPKAAIARGQDIFMMGGSHLIVDSNELIILEHAIGSDHDKTPSPDFSGGLTKRGSGTLILRGENTYLGGTILSGGTVSISREENLGSTLGPHGGKLTFSGGTLTVTKDLTLQRGADLQGKGIIEAPTNLTLMMSGTVSGNGSLEKKGQGSLVLLGDNAYQGGTIISEGILHISRDLELGGAASPVTINGGMLWIQRSATLSEQRNITVGALGGTINVLTSKRGRVVIEGLFRVLGSFEKQGRGTLKLQQRVNSSLGSEILIKDGTLEMEAGQIRGKIVNAGTLIFDQKNDGTVFGTIEGNNELLKKGTGKLTIGRTSYGGPIRIDAGTLEMEIVGFSNNIFNWGTLILNQTTDKTFSGQITGNGKLIKSGGGTLTLGRIDAGKLILGRTVYDGSIKIANGELKMQVERIGGEIEIENVGTLTFDQIINGVVSGQITGTGELVKSGTGSLKLGTMRYDGSLTINAGTLETEVERIKKNVLNEGTLILDQTISGTIKGKISGNGRLEKKGGKPLTLEGANAYAGEVVIKQGALQLSGLGNLGEMAHLTIQNGSLAILKERRPRVVNIGQLDGEDANSSVFLNDNTLTVKSGDFPGRISGQSGTLKKMDSGTLILSGENSYTGQTIIDEGILQLKGLGSVGIQGSVSLLIRIGQLVIAKEAVSREVSIDHLVGNDPVGKIELHHNRLAVKRGSFAGVVAGQGGSLVKKGEGTLTLSGENTYTLSTLIEGGRLEIADPGNLYSNSNVIITDGDLFLKEHATGREVEIAALHGQGEGVKLNNNTLTVKSGDFSGVISGQSGTLRKIGDGTLTLSGDNQYTGTTDLIGGVLNPVTDAALGHPEADLVFNGGTLLLPNGFRSLARQFRLEGPGTIQVPAHREALLSGVFGGNGQFTKTGSGKLTLTRPINHLGSTQIEGTLQLTPRRLGSNINMLGPSTILIFDQTTPGRYDGALSGAGVVLKTGNKSLTLSHQSDHSGVIIIIKGILELTESATKLGRAGLIINEDGALSLLQLRGPLQVNTLNGIGTISLNSNTLEVGEGTFFGIISSGIALGGLTKTGTGTLTLTGVSTYRGPTVIQGGILDLGATGIPGQQNDLRIDIGQLELGAGHPGLEIGELSGTKDAKIDLKSSSLQVKSGTFSGVIAGEAGSSLEKIDDGTLTLSGNLQNTFSTLFLRGGALEFSSNAQLGKELLTLGGGTLVPSQTLSITSPIELIEHSAVTVQSPFKLTLTGVLRGSSRLTKTGSGTLIIDSDSSPFEGELLLQAGTLILPEGKKLGEKGRGGVKLVALGTTLIGAGHLGFVSNTQGTVEVRSSASEEMSILHIDSNYDQGRDAKLKMRIAPSPKRADVLTVAGTATLDGDLVVDPQPGIYLPGTIYTIIEAGTIPEQSEFKRIIETHPFDFELLYHRNHLLNSSPRDGRATVELKVQFTEAVLPVDLASLIGNARQIGDYLFSCRHSPSEELTSILQHLVQLPQKEFIQGLLQLGPQQFGGIALSNLESNVCIARAANHMEILYDTWFTLPDKDLENRSTQSLWVTPIGIYDRQDRWEKQIPFHSLVYGFTAGYTFALNGLYFDIGASYTDSHLNWDHSHGTAAMQTVYLTPSIGYIDTWGYIGFVISLAHRFYDVTRNIQFSRVQRAAHSRHLGGDILGGCVGALRFKLSERLQNDLFLMPTLRLDCSNSFESSYTEKGAGPLNLSLKQMHTAFLRSEFNLKCMKYINRGALRIVPTLFVGWLMDLPLSRGYYRGGLQEETCQKELIVQSQYSPTSRINAGGELLITCLDHCAFKTRYRASWKSDHCVQEGTLSWNWDF